jgi:uncharacterized RDD family membrane protein YckC
MADTPIVKLAYAAPGVRAAAFLLDFMVFMVVLVAVALAFEGAGARPPQFTQLAIAAAYLGLLPATPLGGTLGKRMMGICIVGGDGKPVGLGRSLARLALFVPSVGLAGVGLVAMAFTARRQALHDLAAGTLVVRRGATAEELARLPAPTSWPSRIGIAVSVAFAALVLHSFAHIYQERRLRERADALLASARPYQDEVARSLGARLPLPPPAKAPRDARSMTAQPGGVIVIEVGDDLAPGARLILRPAAGTQGRVEWRCSAVKVRPAMLPAWCRT